MTDLQTWITPARDHAPLPPLFVLTHDGVAANLLDDLLSRAQSLAPVAGIAPMLPDLARAWIALRQQQPLRNLRKTHAETPSWHPWYGAATTDPWALSQGLGSMLYDHMQPGLTTGRHPVIVIRELFWNWDDCLGFADFLITAFPGSRLLLVTGDWLRAPSQFSETTGWNLEEAGKAVSTMTGHYHALGKRFPKRSLLWTLSEAEDAPARAAELAAFLGWETDLPQSTETEDAPSEDI